MRSVISVLAAGVWALACATQSEAPNSSGAGGAANLAGAAATAGSQAASAAAAGTTAGGSGDAGSGDAGSGDAGSGVAGSGVAQPPTPLGRALMVVGTIPLVGTDVEIRRALESRNLMVEEFRDDALRDVVVDDHRIIVLSYSMLSTSLQDSFADTEASVIVMEHNLLPTLAMTSEDGHGFERDITQISIISEHPVLAAGFPPGDLTVYLRSGSDAEMFWGEPGEGAIRVATVPGNPDRTVYFAYPAGAMMIDRPAPGKRIQFFFSLNAPSPVPDLYLNDAGMKLLGGAIDWCLE